MMEANSCEEIYLRSQGMSDEDIALHMAIRETWAKTEEEAEEAVQRIIVAAAERAKVLFDTFGFQWVTEESRSKPIKEHESEVPSLERIIESLKGGVQDLREHGLCGGSGRLYIQGDYDEFDELTGIRLFFQLGSIPINWLWENGPMIAKEMEYENQGLSTKVKNDAELV